MTTSGAAPSTPTGDAPPPSELPHTPLDAAVELAEAAAARASELLVRATNERDRARDRLEYWRRVRAAAEPDRAHDERRRARDSSFREDLGEGSM